MNETTNNTFMIKVQDDIFETMSNLEKLQAVLEQLGDKSYFTDLHLDEYTQAFVVANHETNSRLYYVLIDYIEKCKNELESISNKIGEERRGNFQQGGEEF